MNIDPNSPSADLEDLHGHKAVSAYFDDREAAEKAAAALTDAGFASGTIYVIPREPGFAVTATDPARVVDATRILREAGGEIRLAEKSAPKGTVSSATASLVLPEQESATGDSIGGGMFTPGSSAGGAGAGTASGGGLW